MDKKRQLASDFQKKFREEQAKAGRKAVTVWLDADIHEFIEQVKEQKGFANIRETTYHYLQKAVKQAKDNPDNDTDNK